MGSVRRSSATARLAANEEIITCVTPKPRLDDILARVPQSVVVCGHTHVQFDRTHSGKRIVNAGSVGMPYERERGAYWVLLGPDVTLRRTGYDIEKAAILFGTTAFPGSGEFARDLLSPPDPDDTSEYFEKGGPGARSTRLNAVVENLGDCVSQTRGEVKVRNVAREITSEERELVSGLLGGLDRDLAEFRVAGGD